MIRVLVLAPSTLMRAGLDALLAASDRVELVTGTQADVVVAALAPGDDQLPDDLPATAGVVLLADQPDPAWIADALRSGVRAVLPQDAGASEILGAIEAAAAGLIALHPQDAAVLLAAAAHSEPPALAPEHQTLSPREVEVLRMLAEGLGNKTIAWKLGISEHTVKFHVASIMNKLNAGSRTEAVTLGVRRGLILL